MKKQQGFTLIELIVVIVILGVLAVTAAPRFLDVQKDARYSTLTGLEGAISSANSMAYGGAAINGDEGKTTATIKMGGNTVNLVYGSLAATTANLNAAIGFVASDWEVDSTTAGTLVIWPNGQANTSSCKLTYVQATSTTVPASLTKATADPDECK